MQLEKHIAQGHLVYLNQGDDSISISENEHYRWLSFSDVIQSVMHKRKPWKLTLPHQTALLLPLLFFKPSNITELGLGGGNLGRYLTHLSNDIIMQSIECNITVINAFNQYFNPEKIKIDIIKNDSYNWLNENVITDISWIICDVYRQETQKSSDIIKQLEQLVSATNNLSCLSINFPDSSDDEINLYLTVLQQLQSSHHIIYFHIPNYLNIIIHLYPKHWQIHRLIKRNKNSYLPQNIFNRWRKFWRHGKQLNR